MGILASEISQSVRRLRFLVISLALVTAAVVPGRALTPNGPHPDQTPQREILLNGLRILSTAMPGDRVAVVCVIRAGAMFDPAGKSGVANLTAGLLSAGAGSYTGERIRGELDDANASLKVRTTWDAVWIDAEVSPEKLAQLFDVLSLMLSEPRFAQADVDAAKKIALDHIAAEDASADLTADRQLNRALYGKHTYGRSVWGDAKTIASITPGDVQSFYNRFYGANSSVLAVCGPVGFDVTVQLARIRFGRWSKRTVVPATFLPPTPAAETRVVVVDRPGTDVPVMRAGFFGPGRTSDDALALMVLAARLDSSLQQKMPNASARAAYDLRMLQSPFTLGCEVPVDRLADAITGLGESLTALQSSPGGTGTHYFMRGATTALVTAHDVAATEFYAGQKLLPDPVDYVPDEARVSAVARTALRPTALTVVVVGDGARISAALKDRFKVEVVSGS